MKTYKKRGIFALVILFLFSFFCYGFWVEPRFQGVKYQTIRLDHLPASWENTKIAFFTDTNFGTHYTIDSLNKTVKRINEAQPDIIIFAGHFFDRQNGKNTAVAELEKTLRSLQAPLGKFAMLATANVTESENQQAQEILTAADFQILANEQRDLYRYQLEPLRLIALNKMVSAEQKTKLLANNADHATLLLDENVNYFSDLANHATIQLMLSYGTYGGYIGIPYINNMIAGTPYPSGFYKHDKQTLLVSNGIGTPPHQYFRIFNYPTLYIVTIQQRK